jgi:hypothetical protein
MDGFEPVLKIPAAAWEKMTKDQQDSFNRRVFAVNEYNETKNVTGPVVLFIGGCVLGFFGLFHISIAALGGFLCLLALLWMMMKVFDRAHQYQRVRDAEAEYRRLMTIH